jgi:transposase
MYRDLTQWTRIRRRVLAGSVSQKQITRETGISRETVRKMVEFPIPPGYRRKTPREQPKLRLCSGLIDGIVKEDQGKSKKQQHTARQIGDWLRREHGFTGGYTIVKDYAREARRRTGSTSTSSPRGMPSVSKRLVPKTRQCSPMSSFRL